MPILNNILRVFYVLMLPICLAYTKKKKKWQCVRKNIIEPSRTACVLMEQTINNRMKKNEWMNMNIGRMVATFFYFLFHLFVFLFAQIKNRKHLCTKHKKHMKNKLHEGLNVLRFIFQSHFIDMCIYLNQGCGMVFNRLNKI